MGQPPLCLSAPAVGGTSAVTGRTRIARRGRSHASELRTPHGAAGPPSRRSAGRRRRVVSCASGGLVGRREQRGPTWYVPTWLRLDLGMARAVVPPQPPRKRPKRPPARRPPPRHEQAEQPQDPPTAARRRHPTCACSRPRPPLAPHPHPLRTPGAYTRTHARRSVRQTIPAGRHTGRTLHAAPPAPGTPPLAAASSKSARCRSAQLSAGRVARRDGSSGCDGMWHGAAVSWLVLTMG